MEDTYTFKDCENKFEFTVKREFLKRCGTPSELYSYELITKYDLPKYLHNPSGPAIFYLETKFCQYWLNGKMLSDQEGQKIAHDYKFNNKLMKDILDE